MIRRSTMRAGTLLFALGLGGSAAAQQPGDALISQEKQAMAVFAWMDGVWQGEATVQTPNGALHITQTEHVRPLLGATVRTVEGSGKLPDGRTGFEALGIISYDPGTASFVFRSYAQGHSGNFPITPTANGWAWEMASGPLRIRYSATFDGKVWHEVGERLVQGAAPVRMFEMNLAKLSGSGPPSDPGR